MHNQTKKNSRRQKRAMRVRKKVQGTSVKPRLSVYRTNNHISAQLIDDVTGQTLVNAGTLSRELRATEFNRKGTASAKKIGTMVAEGALEKGISEVVFDRGCYKYHGLIAALADGAREGGLKF